MDKTLEIGYLRKLAKGDDRSFELLFLDYHPKMVRFLYGFIKDEEEAYDMAQEIFYKVWVNRESLAEVTSFKSYLFTMARNMIYNYYEHNLVKEKYILRQSKDQDEYGLEDELFAKDLSLLIDLLVSQMPEQRQRVFTLSRKNGLSNDEIAERLHLNKRTVENHLSNALRDLRKALTPLFCLFLL
ncbi:MAG TPA: RNA polymerase sigma-70 factor [Porphyromonadaceae bacterium]|jgi:RNA polymerase sigma-70 factor (ECF subfamily)|uniref:RNA polymerase sigma-70 factor n=1 Tax=Limibacterium fermenti TaxID=3229863 RepID=UPI000E89685B|nr:RNA polymerase sigma-70 factor [Porphyromonadaceae bacterium]HBX21413.1 RNA polymerase sigma-70 factor [Porphyromonadaceae bacterium]HBX46640.1 RNA polymerase sigma-70 factor [Porphyromonadaceae bacterium]HCM21908.1 RNA polymerase sigma-70 factor [Porphyromonadaceae bacterium]